MRGERNLHRERRLVANLPRLPLKRPGDADLVRDVSGFVGGVPDGVVGEHGGGEGRVCREGPAVEGGHFLFIFLNSQLPHTRF